MNINTNTIVVQKWNSVTIHSLGIKSVDVSINILVPLLPSSRPFQHPQRQVPQSTRRRSSVRARNQKNVPVKLARFQEKQMSH